MISEYVNLYGEWCEGEIDLLRKILEPDSIAIEVGSNIGMHAVPISLICEHGTIYCYEPQRILSQILAANMAINDRTNAIIRQCAAFNEAKLEEIESCQYEQPWNYGAFSIANGFSHEQTYPSPTHREPVEFVRLDDDQCLSGLKRLDLLKIDAEGSETAVIDGAQHLITKFKPAILAEANTAKGFNSLKSILDRLNYQCYWHCSRRARQNNFNLSSWLISGADINILCLHSEKSKPPNLVTANAFSDLESSQVPLY
jgi:FkbM family methyltransferase